MSPHSSNLLLFNNLLLKLFALLHVVVTVVAVVSAAAAPVPVAAVTATVWPSSIMLIGDVQLLAVKPTAAAAAAATAVAMPFCCGSLFVIEGGGVVDVGALDESCSFSVFTSFSANVAR